MKALLAAALFAASIQNCTGRSGAPAEPVDYDPTRAGSVAHALCLLGYTGVPLRELSSGHHVVEASVNGRRGTFVLDTGANATVLHSGFAQEFGLGRGIPSGAIGIGGSMQASQVRVDSLAVGPVATRQRRVMTTDLSQLTRMLAPLAGGHVHGIVGQDVMKEHRAIVDVSGRVVHLIEEDRDPAPVPAERCRGRSR